MVTKEEEEMKAVRRNEEKLWDLAAITAAPTLYMAWIEQLSKGGFTQELKTIEKHAAEQAYSLADALIVERRRRFLEDKKDV